MGAAPSPRWLAGNSSPPQGDGRCVRGAVCRNLRCKTIMCDFVFRPALGCCRCGARRNRTSYVTTTPQGHHRGVGNMGLAYGALCLLFSGASIPHLARDPRPLHGASLVPRHSKSTAAARLRAPRQRTPTFVRAAASERRACVREGSHAARGRSRTCARIPLRGELRRTALRTQQPASSGHELAAPPRRGE